MYKTLKINDVLNTNVIKDAIDILHKQYNLLNNIKVNPRNGRSFFVKKILNKYDVFFMKIWCFEEKISIDNQKWINKVSGDFEKIYEKWIIFDNPKAFEKSVNPERRMLKRKLDFKNCANDRLLFVLSSDQKSFVFKGVFRNTFIYEKEKVKVYERINDFDYSILSEDKYGK